MSHKKKVSKDLQGINKLIIDATIGITDLTEKMHHQIVHPKYLPSTGIQHLVSKIARLNFKIVKFSTKFIGNGVHQTLDLLTPILGKTKNTFKTEAIRATLNGVIGDHLKNDKNPLAIKMQFRNDGNPISLDAKTILKEYPNSNGKILLLLHGCCMNDLQWTQNGYNYGELLAKELGKTPVFLNYNSGLHVSENGKELNKRLEKLVLNWPVKVDEIVILAHSMGGLVTRSALHYGQSGESSWIKKMSKVIFLGTPHHGAPLEKAGNIVDVILEATPYAKPFAKLGKIRSAGVTDLRYGYIIDEDWQNKDRFKLLEDNSSNISLPKIISFYSIAAVVGKKTTSVSSALLGDKMVTVKSALGKHSKRSKNLNFKKENTWIAYETSHIELLGSAEIYKKIKSWLIAIRC
jgi:hypothetical protein